MKRYLAQMIIDIDGTENPTSILELSDDGKQMAIFPFEEETAETVYVPGTITVKVEGGRFVAHLPGKADSLF